MGYVPDAVIAEDMILRDTVDLPAAWWADTRKALNAVADVRDTKRVIIGDDMLRHHAATLLAQLNESGTRDHRFGR